MAVRRNAATAQPQEIAVPDVQQAHAHRQVALQRGRDEMRIHGVGPREQGAEMRGPDGDGNRQADGRPQRITPAHPIPEAQGAADAELRRLLHIGGQGDEMLGNGAIRPVIRRAAMGQEPGARRMGVEHGFGRGERLGSHEEQGALRAHARQHMAQLMSVHVRNEMKALAGVAPVLERVDHHFGPQMGAADADVDHIGDVGHGPHLLRQGQHRVQGAVHLVQGLAHRCRHGRDRRLRTQQAAIAWHAQQPVHGRALFGGVDRLPGEHALALRGQGAFLRQCGQQLLGVGRDAVLGQIGKHMGRLLTQRGQALRVGGEIPGDVELRHVLPVMARKRPPGCGFIALHAHPRQPPVASKFPA
ncbi:hypothetical protein D3C78_907330 [compost metagenome]